MTDKEKIAMLIGFIRGTIGSKEYVATIDVQSANEIINKVEGAN